MARSRIAAFVMAGGEGRRLRPLTEQLAKPALPFAGCCRIIDFALANLHHSGVAPIFVVLQYKPAALLEHSHRYWPGVVPLLPQRSYAGTADAVGQNLHHIDGVDPDLVAVFAADHVYRMDVRQMADFHVACDADATIAALPMPIEQVSEFGVLVTDRDGRITAFQEKSARPAAAPDDPTSALVSMGNYLFAPDVLRGALDHAARRGTASTTSAATCCRSWCATRASMPTTSAATACPAHKLRKRTRIGATSAPCVPTATPRPTCAVRGRASRSTTRRGRSFRSPHGSPAALSMCA